MIRQTVDVHTNKGIDMTQLEPRKTRLKLYAYDNLPVVTHIHS